MKLKTLLASTLIICLAISVNAQKRIQLDSNTTTTSYDFSDYDTIEVSGDFEIELNHSSNSESITVESNSNLVDYISVNKEGRTLRFKLKSVWSTKGKMILNVSIDARGTVDTFRLSGDAIVNVNKTIKANTVDLALKGDSVLAAKVMSDNLNIMAKSDSVIKIEGEVNSLNAKLSSDSLLKGKELSVKDVNIDLSGDSQAWVIATSSLKAVASGDSVLKYGGNPEVKKSVSTGDSEIHRMN